LLPLAPPKPFWACTRTHGCCLGGAIAAGRGEASTFMTIGAARCSPIFNATPSPGLVLCNLRAGALFAKQDRRGAVLRRDDRAAGKTTYMLHGPPG
jgi:hypothetical protein